MLKPTSKRRRPKAQIEEDKRKAIVEKEAIARKLRRLEELEFEWGGYTGKRKKIEHNERLVEEMYEQGVIKNEEDGMVTLVNDEKERIQLSSKVKQQKQAAKANLSVN